MDTLTAPARLRLPIGAEIRWSFTPPRHWLEGLGVNIVLSLLYLLWSPLVAHGHHGWVVLVGTYFATFILADVTTTNIIGIDATRVRQHLAEGSSIARILLTKNFALLAIVGLPTMLLTAILTAVLDRPRSLIVTLPDVALPILAWLGVGNIVSVLLPVATVPLIQRWRRRKQWRSTATWIFHLVLPYGLYYIVAPVDGAQREILGRQLSHELGPEMRGLLHALFGLAIWLIGTAVAAAIVRRRGLPLL